MTQRTLAETLATLPATPGAISAVDLQDLVESLAPSVGALNLTLAAETTIATLNTFVKAEGTTALLASSRGFSQTDNMRIAYTGAPDRLVRLVGALSVSGAAGAVTAKIRVLKNAAQIDGVNDQRIYIPAVGVSFAACFALTTLASASDYFEVHIANEDTTDNLTIQSLHLSAIGHIS